MQKLFRIDVKYKTTGTAGETGTGLGSGACREFVEKERGPISGAKVLRIPGPPSISLFPELHRNEADRSVSEGPGRVKAGLPYSQC